MKGNGKDPAFERLFDPKKPLFEPRKRTDDDLEAAIKAEEAEAERDAVARISWVESGDYRKFLEWVHNERRIRLRSEDTTAIGVGELKMLQRLEDKLDGDAQRARELLYGGQSES